MEQNPASTRIQRPSLTFWQIWNMCFGFLGIQFGFALQNANVSRIFQTLGASIDDVPALWIAAPLTGLLVQPVIGYFSDRTWTRLGRRRPYFLAGALVASLALIAMPNSPTLWVAAGLLWVLDAAINVAMEPFRAFVGDQMPPAQRAAGFSMQSFFIGAGAVVASALPWFLAHAGVANTAPAGVVPDAVRYAFYLGAAVLVGAVGWTVLRTREATPEALDASDPVLPASLSRPASTLPRAWPWLLSGAATCTAVYRFGLDRQLYLLGAGLLLYGALVGVLARRRSSGMVATILADLRDMPDIMRRLAVVQFFSWFALFAMWIYTTAAVAQVHFGATDARSPAYNEGANWVGVLFAAYNGFAMLAAMAIPPLARRIGARGAHAVNLLVGAASFLSIGLIPEPTWLLVPMMGIGVAWASILSLPYALLSDHLPARKMGVYMGIFNFFIVIPQLVAATVLGFALKSLFGGAPIHALTLGGVSLVVAALSMLRIGATRRETMAHGLAH
ncbi:MFS transporter [Tahibacter amnicola]|uniref:MFS transporter n=1 Tax=Tahibacter amnicola TaxID=2976241 RepID=A0ABY6BDL8_9GAMM|nr:MFS transporter [Tahibacter amnicola]UXI68118.1 MFS transporter [Tahibacter amnicola]